MGATRLAGPAAALDPALSYAPRRPKLERGSPDWSVMLRSLMVIWALGASFFLILLVTTNPPPGVGRQILRIDVICFMVLGILLAGRERLPAWTPDVCAYLMYSVVGWIILVYQEPASPYSFFYLWLSVHSFYFLTWQRAAPQVAFIAVNYAVTLAAITGPDFPMVRWVVTTTTMLVICTLVALLKARVDALVDRLAGTARADPLTGLRNRRAYDEIIDIEIARADRAGQPLSLALCDLDHFKRVNDALGHPAGDAVLRRVASELLRTERRVDMAFRLGGEEFAVLLPNTDADGAYLVAERMRIAVQRACRRQAVPVTLSFGIASYPDDEDDPDKLFAVADAALLRAKQLGRDRTVRWEDCPADHAPRTP